MFMPEVSLPEYQTSTNGFGRLATLFGKRWPTCDARISAGLLIELERHVPGEALCQLSRDTRSRLRWSYFRTTPESYTSICRATELSGSTSKYSLRLPRRRIRRVDLRPNVPCRSACTCPPTSQGSVYAAPKRPFATGRHASVNSRSRRLAAVVRRAFHAKSRQNGPNRTSRSAASLPAGAPGPSERDRLVRPLRAPGRRVSPPARAALQGTADSKVELVAGAQFVVRSSKKFSAFAVHVRTS
jgi:hypothetical protein